MSDEIHPILRTLFSRDTTAVFLEIGCHYGHDSMQLRTSFPNARIICFEPDPRNIYTFKRSGVHKHVELIEAAVSDTDGTTTMYLSGGRPAQVPKNAEPVGWTASSSIKKPDQVTKIYPWMNFTQTAKVTTTRLDTFCAQNNIDQIGFIWADVQGAEAEVLAGGQGALAKTKYLFTEFGFQRLYEGELGPDDILARLPGKWDIMGRWTYDMLLKNAAFT